MLNNSFFYLLRHRRRRRRQCRCRRLSLILLQYPFKDAMADWFHAILKDVASSSSLCTALYSRRSSCASAMWLLRFTLTPYLSALATRQIRNSSNPSTTSIFFGKSALNHSKASSPLQLARAARKQQSGGSHTVHWSLSFSSQRCAQFVKHLVNVRMLLQNSINIVCMWEHRAVAPRFCCWHECLVLCCFQI